MVEAGRKCIKDLVKNFHVVSIFTQFQFDLCFNFKLPKWLRRAIRIHLPIPWPRRAMKKLKLQFSCLIASAKFQSVMGALRHPTLVDKYQAFYSNIFASSILFMVYYLSVLCSVWGMRVVGVTQVVFEVYSRLFLWQVPRWKDDSLFECYVRGLYQREGCVEKKV